MIGPTKNLVLLNCIREQLTVDINETVKTSSLVTVHPDTQEQYLASLTCSSPPQLQVFRVGESRDRLEVKTKKTFIF